tara:strand:- start:2405 stop:3088 length:684 start_codon:yes stop_codon:yes gene_type:complete
MARTKLKLKGMTTGTIPGRIKVASENINAMAASKLTGAMPSLDGSALTGTSDMVHIKTQTGTNASSIDFLHGTSDVVFDGTYDVYEFIIHYAYGASNAELRIEPSQDGSGFTTTNTLGFTVGGYRASSSNSAWTTNLGTAGFFKSAVNMGNAENEISGGQIRVYSPFDSAKNTVAVTTLNAYQASGTYASQITAGGMSAAGRTHGLRFKTNSGNIYAKVSLYGIKDS